MSGKWELSVGSNNLDTFVLRPDGTKYENAVEVQVTVGVDSRYVRIKYVDFEASKNRGMVVYAEMTIPFDEFRIRYPD